MDETKNESLIEKVSSCKVLSKIAMLLSGLWIITATVLKGVGLIELSIKDIIAVGAALVVVWSPAYLSIHLDKLINKSVG